MEHIKYLIIGAGPTGLGAAYRLKELGESDFLVLEAHDYSGGLATSFKDSAGFTWDIGGHVQFSHYDYFDKAIIPLLEWNELERESWVWIEDRFVPYPFQNNIKYLKKETMWKCLQGLIDIYKTTPYPKQTNFKEWIYNTFGEGLAKVFMIPYNFKVWAYPPETMNYSWIGERVAQTDLARVTKNILFNNDDLSWGPNNKFKFPLKGGTGAIWKAVAEKVGLKKIKLNSCAIEISSKEKTVTLKDGTKLKYDYLMSTIPLDKLCEYLNDIDDSIKKTATELVYSSTNIIGIGLKGKGSLGKKCWMYFPEDNCPYYRATVFSNYSKFNVPDPDSNWSLMLEVSESTCKPVNQSNLLEETIDGLVNTKLIANKDDIISTWQYRTEYGYPTPSIGRDGALAKLIPYLDSLNIYSRGRFGAWKYEVSNQDHSFMQGVEWANKIALDIPELTLRFPSTANAMWGMET